MDDGKGGSYGCDGERYCIIREAVVV